MQRALILLVALILGACDSGPAATMSAPIAASDLSGRFALSFTIEHGTVRPSDVVVGAATLTLVGPGGATISGPSPFVGFEFTEVGGSHRQVGFATDAVCEPHRVTSNSPIVTPITKPAGAGIPAGPDGDWYRKFLADPLLHLPAGDWDVTASSTLFDASGCSGAPVNLRVTLRVHVVG